MNLLRNDFRLVFLDFTIFSPKKGFPIHMLCSPTIDYIFMARITHYLKEKKSNSVTNDYYISNHDC